MLRKLAATRLVELGVNEYDLLKIMGWSSIETSKFYIQPKSDTSIQQMFERL